MQIHILKHKHTSNYIIMQRSVIQRFADFGKSKKKSEKKFCESLNLSKNTYNQWKRLDNPPSVDVIVKAANVYPDLNLDWLLRKKGEMLKSAQEYHNFIPLVPFAHLGTKLNTMDDQAITRYKIPDFNELGVDYLTTAISNDMAPTYLRGDIIACKDVDVNSFLLWGKAYLVNVNQGFIIRRIKPGPSNDDLILQSDNSDYDPITIKRSDIKNLSIVKGIVRIE